MQYELLQMFKAIALIWLVAVVSSRLLQSDLIQGTLKIKSFPDKKEVNDKSFDVIAAINTPQIYNIVHETIEVVTANPIHGCSPYTIPDNLLNPSVPVYFLVSGGDGDCSYARKVDLAKKTSAKGIIIVDSPKGVNNLKLRFNQKDRFISLIITEQQGIKLYTSLGKSDFIGQLNMGKGSDSKAKTSFLQIWISSLNQDSYKVLHDWKDVVEDIPALQNRVYWFPRFAFYQCSINQACKSDYVSSCACGGSFCSPEQHGKSSNVLVRQDIRQYLVFKLYPNLFLKYMKKFYKNCFPKYAETKYVEDCANGLLHDLEMDEPINDKIDSFLYSCSDKEDAESSALFGSLMLDRNKYKQIGHYPTFILNHQQLQFRTEDELKAQICRKLGLEQQQGCVHIVQSTVLETVISWIFYILLFPLLIGAGAFAVIFFRNKLRKEMNKELKMQVSTAVEHYFTLSQAH